MATNEFPRPWRAECVPECFLYNIRSADGSLAVRSIHRNEADRILAAVNNPAVKGLVEALDRIAFHPLGAAEATDREVLDCATKIAREAIAAYRASIGGGQ